MLHYTFHMSLSPAFVYVNNAKCGCTTAKASINTWYAAWHGKALSYNTAAEIHERAHNPLLNPPRVGPHAQDMILRDKDVFRFTLFREPLSRIASAYASKLLWDTRERRLVNRAAGRAEDAPVSFGDFVALICGNEDLRDSNEHWRPQTRQIAASLIQYDEICLQAHLRADLLKVRDRLFPGLDVDVFDASTRFASHRSSSKQVFAAMTAHEIALIQAAYADDFTFYDKILAARKGGGQPA